MHTKKEFKKAKFNYWFYSIIIFLALLVAPVFIAYGLKSFFHFQGFYPLLILSIIFMVILLGITKVFDFFEKSSDKLQQYKKQGNSSN